MMSTVGTCEDTDTRDTETFTPERIQLRDGSTVAVRPVRAADRALLVDGFARLSPSSRRFRFLTGKEALTASEVEYLTNIDHCDHEAIGAVDVTDRRGVGIARFVRSRTDETTAEVAVTVVDEWHRRGLGTLLLARLVDRARAAGIHAFVALVATDNLAMIGLLSAKPGVELVHADLETLEFEISLARFASGLDGPRRSVTSADDLVSERIQLGKVFGGQL
jgi:RimJ/RimL family protein N-acetyltransferase